MKQIEKIAAAENFSAVNVGKLDELGDYLLELGPEVKIPGKVFGGGAVGATGGEFSFQIFRPGTETGFLHTHKKASEQRETLLRRGDPAGTRTPDPRLKRQLLYRLSYWVIYILF